MRLLTYRHGGTESYGAVKGEGVVDLGRRLKPADLSGLLEAGLLDAARAVAAAEPADVSLDDIVYLPPVPRPDKFICVGINYLSSVVERKLERPKYPSLFVRFPGSQTGHLQPVIRPRGSQKYDFEGEMAVVIGRRGRHIPEAEALAHIAGYTCVNEGTEREWVRHGVYNVTPGKNFHHSGAVGPWLVTADEIADPAGLAIRTRVNDEVVQEDVTGRLVFSIGWLINYISTFTELLPGDVISTGTPAGARDKADPPIFLDPGDVVEVEVEGIGTLRNQVVDEA